MFRPSKPRTRRAGRLLAGLLAAGLVAACAGAPVQAMSDARQTISAAEAAGAERVAPDRLAAAREGVRKAQELLRHGEYRAASREAEAARAHAAAALEAAGGSASAPAHGGTPNP